MAKHPDDIRAAKEIGDDSYSLVNFESLPKNASKARQVEALRKDEHWQYTKRCEVSRAISDLIEQVEGR